MAAIFHGLILLLSAITIPVLLNQIPLASLAAILLMVGYKLANPSLFRSMFKLGWEQFMPFVITIVAILATDLLKGIGIGMCFAIFYILRKNYRNSYHSQKESTPQGEVIRLRLSEEVTFLNKASIRMTLDDLPENSRVIVDGSHSENIDYDVLEAIQDFKKHTAALKNITIETIGIREVQVSGH